MCLHDGSARCNRVPLALATAAVTPSYVGWWSAASVHGFTTQIPLTAFIAVTGKMSERECRNRHHPQIPQEYLALLGNGAGTLRCSHSALVVRILADALERFRPIRTSSPESRKSSSTCGCLKRTRAAKRGQSGWARQDRGQGGAGRPTDQGVELANGRHSYNAFRGCVRQFAQCSGPPVRLKGRGWSFTYD
jgi:hypothetical protein